MLIAIDHGNQNIKTAHHAPFVAGVQESDVKPFGNNVLQYGEKYYRLTDQRIPYHRDKTEDDRFFILTLYAIAYEIEATNSYTDSVMRVQLAVGLPPAHYGAQHNRFTQYFMGRGAIRFSLDGKPYSIYIERVSCFPQSYAAAITIYKELRDIPKALIIDLGGYTADYLRMVKGSADLSTCDSLENGVIKLYNGICSRGRSELDLLLEPVEIDAILSGGRDNYAPEVSALVEQQAQIFADDLLRTLREIGLELKTGKVVFVGGGAMLLRRQLENSGKVGSALFVTDIDANAKGYELLYQIEQAGR